MISRSYVSPMVLSNKIGGSFRRHYENPVTPVPLKSRRSVTPEIREADTGRLSKAKNREDEKENWDRQRNDFPMGEERGIDSLTDPDLLNPHILNGIFPTGIRVQDTCRNCTDRSSDMRSAITPSPSRWSARPQGAPSPHHHLSSS